MIKTIKREVRGTYNLLLPIVIVLLLYPANIVGQDLIKDILKNVDAINQQLLNITALSDEEENQIGKDLDAKISREFKAGKEKKFDVKKIFNLIKKKLSRNKINYRYSVVEVNDVNAFAIAGGKIFICTELLKFLDNEDELAFVIAHELAHIELKHCIKRVQYAAIASGVDPLIGTLVQVAYSIYSTPFSKYEEFEADELGVKLMQKAGYNKKGAISFFEKLKALEQQYGVDKRDELNDFISSHPTSEERKERIKKHK